MTIRRMRRPAFTLIEMLVVIGLILLLAAIVVVAIPSAGDRNMQQAADKLQGALLIVKQRAKFDRLPTGLRIEFGSATQATKLTYVQQPEDFILPGTTCSADGTGKIAFYDGTNPQGQKTNIDLIAAGVQAGDWIEIYRGGSVYMIGTPPTAKGVTLAVNASGLYPNTGLNPNTGMPNTTADYRVFRQPIPVLGEEPIELPEGIVIDSTLHPWTSQPRCLNLPVGVVSSNVPILTTPGAVLENGSSVTVTTQVPHGFSVGQTVQVAGVANVSYNGIAAITSVPTPSSFTYTNAVTGLAPSGSGTASLVSVEIMFAPQGGLVGRGSGSDKVCVLWLSNINNTSIGSFLIAIQAHTGLIAAHPENTDKNAAPTLTPPRSANDPHYFTRNMRSSGL